MQMLQRDKWNELVPETLKCGNSMWLTDSSKKRVLSRLVYAEETKDLNCPAVLNSTQRYFRPKYLERDGFKCQPPAFKCQVAEVDKQVVGYTIYFNAYSSWAGRAMLLEDLYVLREQRKKGIGEALFDAVAKDAATTGCARLDFHVVRWNKATGFYETKGAVNLTEKEQWCYFRLSGDALKRYADNIHCIPPRK